MQTSALGACLIGLMAGTICLGAAETVEPYSRTVLDEPGLVSYWRFEGDCRDAKGVAPGEVRGGQARYVAGPGGGQAIALGDGRFLTMGAAPKLDLPQTTLEMWLCPTAAPRSTPYSPCIIAKRRSSPETRFSVHVWPDYSQLALWNGRRVVKFPPPDGPLRRGQWYYLAVTCSKAAAQVYLDGVPCKPLTPPNTFTFSAVDLPLQIGASSPGGTERFACAIDEVAIYSRVLSAAEVARHADAMGWKGRREQLARAAEERLKREKALAAEREAGRAKRLEELMSQERLFARGASRIYSGDHLTGISLTLGGIGAGCIRIDGRAERHAWQIFNNFSQASVPHSFFALRVKATGAKPVVRALQTSAVGPFEAMESLTFRGEYPFGWYAFEDAGLPVAVRMETFTPLIPLRARDSAIPCAIFNLTARNTSERPVEVSLLASQQNAAGFTGKETIEGRECAEYGGNRNRILKEQGATILHMTVDAKKDTPGCGDMALVAIADTVTATASWDGLDALLKDFSQDGALGGGEAAGPSPAGATLDGVLALPFTLKPGESRTVTFVLTWHFPNTGHGRGAWGGKGNMYANWWDSALAVARNVRERYEELARLTHLYHDTFYASNLPHWLLDRITSQVAVLRSKTCFWTKDGYFGGWEGCNVSGGCCHGNCAHVWHYAQAHARLFPEIARRMRELSLSHMNGEGGVPFRHPSGKVAFDGQCGEILEAYREHLCSTDGRWLKKHWPTIKKAMEHVIATWDGDEDGVPMGQQHNTLDAELSGSTSWLGTLYLAALAASERMARLEGQADLAARYRRIYLAGAKKQDATLFDGEYYIQIPDQAPGSLKGENYLTGCHIDQVLGQWWAHQLDLGWLYPPDHVGTALRSLFRYNFRTSFADVTTYTWGSPARGQPRKFVLDDECAMMMTTWPKGGRPGPGKALRFADEVMSGFEYSTAAAMVTSGLLREALTVVRAAADRYDGRLRTGLTDRAWGHSGNPFGDDECGKFYARAMSIWSMLLACQGFIHDGPAGVIGFMPLWKPEDHASFFTTAEGWGLFSQRRTDRTQTERVEVTYGKLRVGTLVFELPEGADLGQATVSVAGNQVDAKATQDGRRVTLALADPAVVTKDQAVEAVLAW